MKWMYIGGLVGGALSILLAILWLSELPGAAAWGGAVGGALTILGMVLGGLWGTREGAE